MLPITSVFASLCVFFYIMLTLRVIIFRRSQQILLGSANNSELESRVRQHGNFIEYTPLTLILMGLTELQGFSDPLIIASGVILIVSRILHCIGLEKTASPIGMQMRVLGMISGLTVLLIFASTLLAHTLL